MLCNHFRSSDAVCGMHSTLKGGRACVALSRSYRRRRKVRPAGIGWVANERLPSTEASSRLETLPEVRISRHGGGRPYACYQEGGFRDVQYPAPSPGMSRRLLGPQLFLGRPGH